MATTGSTRSALTAALAHRGIRPASSAGSPGYHTVLRLWVAIVVEHLQALKEGRVRQIAVEYKDML